MVEQILEEVVKAMSKTYPGICEAMTGAIGMSVTLFNNNLNEKNGCRFFEGTGWKGWRTFPISHYWLITLLRP